MSFKRELKKIAALEVGDFNGDIIVRVARIIRVQEVCHPLRPHRPMIEQHGVHIVVFDESKMKVLLVCQNRNVLRRLGCMFAEQRVLRIRSFEVCLDEATSGGTLYIKCKGNTHIEQIVPSSPRYPQSLPNHCFDLVTISEVIERKARGRGLLDVCGKVVTCYERGMEVADGMDNREVVLVLEETGVLATRQPTMLTCLFHGQCADITLMEYDRADKEGPMQAVVIYAQLSKDEHPTLTEYCDATRTFFNPTFPELLEARQALVGRLSEMYNRNAIPVLPHPVEEPSTDLDHVYLS